uniref:Uncharacterized protein n=1 Tax=Anopheles atroparvus TaxID=41427 RepID=A0AAG5DDE2_ANOAO
MTFDCSKRLSFCGKHSTWHVQVFVGKEIFFSRFCLLRLSTEVFVFKSGLEFITEVCSLSARFIRLLEQEDKSTPEIPVVRVFIWKEISFSRFCLLRLSTKLFVFKSGLEFITEVRSLSARFIRLIEQEDKSTPEIAVVHVFVETDISFARFCLLRISTSVSVFTSGLESITAVFSLSARFI